MKLITIVGARPQFIKAAAISRVIKKNNGYSAKIRESILHTGQHFDENMSNQFFTELGIPSPEINLGISGGSHGENTGRMLESIEKVLLDKKPDGVIVYGDTDSTLAGALAASKISVPIFHIEAGLRSFNRNQPEEQNRIVTDHLAERCFVPTELAGNNLRNEGIAEKRIILTGDVMADTARIFANEAESKAKRYKEFTETPYLLATIHRAENTDNPKRLIAILKALGNIATKGLSKKKTI